MSAEEKPSEVWSEVSISAPPASSTSPPASSVSPPPASFRTKYQQMKKKKYNIASCCNNYSFGSFFQNLKTYCENNIYKGILVILLITFIYMAFYLYFWLVVENDSNDFNWNFTVEYKLKHISWYTIMVSLTAIAFVYLAILVGLSIYYIYVRHQVYIHPFNAVVIILNLLGCISITITLDYLWPSEWVVLKLSFLIFGPFIHIGLVVIFTILSWFLITQWYILDRFCLKLLTSVAYIVILVVLYLFPLFIDFPCIRPTDSLPAKPRLFAHRGASGIAPENTLAAFQIAVNESVYGFETDVRISSDGIPFLLHDDTLRRTTNIEEVFPHRADHDASTFTFAELRKLNAGSWFLEEDPMGVAGSLTDREKKIYNKQTIMSLKELIDLAHLTGKYILMDIRSPFMIDPYISAKENIKDMILNTGIHPKQIWWLISWGELESTTSFTQTWTSYLPAEYLIQTGVFNFNARSDTLSMDEILEYIESNITINIYVVNSNWLYSLYWCLGIQTVATDECHVLNKIEKPLWHLAPGTYLMTWVSVDIISAIIIITILIVQWVRLLRTRFKLETISLHSQQPVNIPIDEYHTNSRTMKEKLLFSADQLEEDIQETTESGSNDHIDSSAQQYINTAANTVVISVPQ